MTQFELASLVIAGAAALISTVSIVISGLGSNRANKTAATALARATEANQIAADANTIATVANATAEEVKHIESRAEARATEHHDVRWVGRWAGRGTYALTNAGTSSARQVAATLIVLGKADTASAEEVEPGGELRFNSVPAAISQIIRANQSLFPREDKIEVIEWVQWATQLGSPKTHERTWSPKP